MKEGINKKGGQNKPPLTSKPNFNPPSQLPKQRHINSEQSGFCPSCGNFVGLLDNNKIHCQNCGYCEE